MSTDPIGAVLTRDDAAVTACAPQIGAEPSNELTVIATAIERVEALLAAPSPEAERTDAIERIADIAFVLHERDVEASLCDALDAAVRELGNANTVKQANVQHVHQAAELLRELSQRVGDMIALLQVSPPPETNDTAAKQAAPEDSDPAAAEQPASVDALDGEIPREGLFAAELLDDDEFARAVAELAASLPSLAEPGEAFFEAQHEPAEFAVSESPHTPAADAAIAESQDEPADRGAAAVALMQQLAEAIVEAQHEPLDLAAGEAAFAPNAADTIPETHVEPEGLAADEPVLAPQTDEGTVELAREAAEFAVERAPQPQAPATGDATALIEPPSAEAVAEAVDEQPSHVGTPAASDVISETPQEEEISAAVFVSESALCETQSEEPPSDDVGEPSPLSGIPDASPDLASANGHAAVLLLDADTPHIPSEALSPPATAPDAMPDSEAALAPGSSTVPTLSTEPELPSLGEPISPPADIGASADAAEQPCDQNMPRHNDGDEPSQTASGETDRHVDTAAAQTATNGSEPPPRRVTESSQSLLPELALVDPQDDPGDLFEPLTAAAPPIAAAALTESEAADEISVHAAAMRGNSAAASADALAAMRTLSAEELLALFT